jgi:hypothetical protein
MQFKINGLETYASSPKAWDLAKHLTDSVPVNKFQAEEFNRTNL